MGSCISLMRAQATGAIPLTSRELNSAIGETAQYDIGPELPGEDIDEHGQPSMSYKSIKKDSAKKARWVQKVIDAFAAGAVPRQKEMLDSYRHRMMMWAQKKIQLACRGTRLAFAVSLMNHPANFMIIEYCTDRGK